MLEHMPRNLPNVPDAHPTCCGTCRPHLVMKINKVNGGQPKMIIMVVFGSHYDIPQIVAVEKDVDIYSADENGGAICASE